MDLTPFLSHFTRENIESLAEIVADKILARNRINQTPGKWLTIKEATEYAKVSRRKMMGWIDEGYIYGFKRTGEWIVDRESIDNWYSSEKIEI